MTALPEAGQFAEQWRALEIGEHQYGIKTQLLLEDSLQQLHVADRILERGLVLILAVADQQGHTLLRPRTGAQQQAEKQGEPWQIQVGPDVSSGNFHV